MATPLLIDAHQDLAYNALTFGRDIRRSVQETRQRETGSPTVAANGDALLGWEEYQRAQVAVAFATLFIIPRRYKTGSFENQDYATFEEAERLLRAQLDFYFRLCDQSPDQFRLVRSRGELNFLLAAWQAQPANFPQVTHPVGLVLSMEGAEGVRDAYQLEAWWQAGVRLIGPVWAGTRLCGGMREGDGFTRDGLEFLEQMAELGYTVDIAHMNEKSALQALERFPGMIISSHANAAGLLKGEATRRHLSDTVIRRLAERGGVIGVVPYNRFLLAGWQNHEPRERVRLAMLVNHIDHICQVTGSTRHVAIGSDFDGGFGYPAVPLELDSIADLPKLAGLLAENGFGSADIAAIFHGNWQRILEQTLPA
ncbi:MAG: membrane dipeptidase [Bellilinea sp.]|jgi:membrane dipeptidase